MEIRFFSKDKNRGLALGSNFLSREKLTAGGITVAVGAIIALLFGRKNRRKAHSDRPGRKKRRRSPLWLALMPVCYRSAKSWQQNKFLNEFADSVEQTAADLGLKGVEIVPGESLESDADTVETFEM